MKTTKTSTESDRFLILGLGSNVGPSEAILRWAIDQLRRFLGPLEVAPLYRSAPISPIAQADFLNTVVLGTVPAKTGTDVPGPEETLGFAKALELEAGRRPGVRFGPRPLDIDLLVWGGERSDRPELTLPHPRLGERRFVLAPLADLRPNLRLPPRGERVSEILARLGREQVVEKVGWSS